MSDLLEKFSDKKIKEANQKLEELCTQYGVTAFKVESSSPRWKELVLNMIDLPVEAKKVGRTKRDDDDVWQIANYVRCLVDFAEMDGKKLPVKQAIYKAVEVFGIQEKEYDSGRTSDPFEVVKGILYRSFPELEERMKQEQKEQDWK